MGVCSKNGIGWCYIITILHYKKIKINMAKAKGGSSSQKVTFGKRKGGKAAKSQGPKDKPVKKYKGQGK
jgi:hypothetical protein